MSKKNNREEALRRAVEEIEKRYGAGAIALIGDTPRMNVQAISTGVLSLDYAIGIGGIPAGRITEIYGPESSGKTTVCLHIAAEAQRRGGNAVFIDMEHALDPVYAEKVGVDVDNLLVSQPDTGEQALEIAEALARSGAVDVIIIDSVAALVPQAEIDGDMGQPQVGLQARLMSQALRKITPAIMQTGTALVFTNQIRHKIGIMFGNPETTAGGMALKFYASVRLDVRRVGPVKDGSEIIGNRTRVRVVKNKVAPPFRTAEFDILYGIGADRYGDVVDLAEALGIITRRGSYYELISGDKIQGRKNVLDYYRENPDAFSALLATVEGKLYEGRGSFGGGYDEPEVFEE